MIITRTPFRISFAGGGSDLPEFYQEHGGCVLSTSINKYVYLSIHPYFLEDKILLKYSKHEHVDSIQQIQHKIIRQVFADFKINGVDFNSSADIPSGTGLASSSAFTVGLLNLIQAYQGKSPDKIELARQACEIEIQKLSEPIGKQDQYACAIGGLNYIQFHPNEAVSIEPLNLSPSNLQKLESNLLLFFLGTTRSASEILKEQKNSLSQSQSKVQNLIRMVALTNELRQQLNRDVDIMGDILHRGWLYKKELSSSISNPEIDHYYQLALKNGATGGKLLGAGGGGFLLFYVPAEAQEKLEQALHPLKRYKFKFDHSGSTVIYSD